MVLVARTNVELRSICWSLRLSLKLLVGELVSFTFDSCFFFCFGFLFLRFHFLLEHYDHLRTSPEIKVGMINGQQQIVDGSSK